MFDISTSPSTSPFYLIGAAGLLAPPIARNGFFLIRRRWPKARLPILYGSALAFISIPSLALSGVSFKLAFANYVSLWIAYFATYVLIEFFRQIRKNPVCMSKIAISAAQVLGGILLGIHGWALWDRSPKEAAPSQVIEGMTCEASVLNVLLPGKDDHGLPDLYWHLELTVHLRKNWISAPFLQREVLTAAYYYDMGAVPMLDPVCRKALDTYHRS